MRVKFGDKRITGKDKHIMEIWGSEDCYFANEEVLELTGMSKEEFQFYLEEFYRKEPEMYQYYADCRKENQKQRRFETKIKELSGDFLDDEFAWNRDQEFINNNDTQNVDRRIKALNSKETDDDIYYSKDNR